MPRNYDLEEAMANGLKEPRRSGIFTIVKEDFQSEAKHSRKDVSGETADPVSEAKPGPAGDGDGNTDTFLMETMPADEAEASRRSGSRWRQHLAALLAALSAVSVGYVDAWTANALPFLQSYNYSHIQVAEAYDSTYLEDSISPMAFPQSSTPVYRKSWSFINRYNVRVQQESFANNITVDPTMDSSFTPPATVVNGVIRGISAEQASWLSSMVPIGAMLGSIPAGVLADAVGRKKVLLGTTIPPLLSWIFIIYFSHSIEMLYFSRFVVGVIMGIVLVVVPLYNEEVADVPVRGAIGVYQNLMVTVGILLCYVVGALVSYYWTAIIACGIPVIMFSTFIWMPESPTYLFNKGRGREAREVIGWLRGGKSMKGVNVYNVTESACKAQPGKSVSVVQMIRLIATALTKRPSALALWIVFMLMIFRQLSGIHAVVFYTVEIFEDAKTAMSPSHAAIIIGVVQVVSTYFASLLVDKWGRRFLLLFSGLGMAFFHISLATYYILLNLDYNLKNISWCPLLFISLFIFSYACGFGPLPWFMMAELTPIEHKNWASGMSGFLNWGAMFLVLKLFPTMAEYAGVYVIFGIFACNCFCAVVFVFFLVPETRGKTLQEIQEEIAETRV